MSIFKFANSNCLVHVVLISVLMPTLCFAKAGTDVVVIDFANTPPPVGVNPNYCWCQYVEAGGYLDATYGVIFSTGAVCNFAGFAEYADGTLSNTPCWSSDFEAATGAIGFQDSATSTITFDPTKIPTVSGLSLTLTGWCRDWTIPGGGVTYNDLQVSAVGGTTVVAPAANHALVTVSALPNQSISSVTISIAKDSPTCGAVPFNIATGDLTIIEGSLDLSTSTTLSVSQTGAVVNPTDGLLDVAPGVPVLVNVPVSGTGFNSPETRSTVITLEAGSQTQSQTISLAAIQAAGTLMVPFVVTFDPGLAGTTQTIEGTVDPGNALKEGTFVNNTAKVKVDVSGSTLQIVQPTADQEFDLTDPISFEGALTPPNPQANLNWTISLSYQTSGGRGSYSSQRTPKTKDQEIKTDSYDSIGGQITYNVSSTVGGQVVTASPVVAYVTGHTIPNDEVTSQLVNLYTNGSTPNLMTGIAMLESSYEQFAEETLFGFDGLWPHESPDGGSHIGLMQMPTTPPRAWNWQTNAQDGVNLFSQKLAAAGRISQRMIKKQPSLPPLTGVQSENMALLLYGPYASASLTRQYYVPVLSGGVWMWSVNTTGNLQGVSYANTVRSLGQ